MASRSILLLPCESLAPSGGFHLVNDAKDKFNMPCHEHQQGQRGARAFRAHHSHFSQRLTISAVYRSSLVSRVLFSKGLEGIYTNAKNGDRFPRLRIMCTSGGSGKARNESTNTENVTQHMRLLLESENLTAMEAAHSLVTSITPEGRAALVSALFPATQQTVDYFEQADVNADGTVDAAEFANFVEAQAHLYEESNKPLTNNQLFHLGTRAALGMVGFGFIDNAIMILAGDVIQNTIGLTLGLSTLMSAGLGNAIADLIGTAFRGYIERISAKFMPEVKISSRQLQFKEAWWAETVGASAGVTVGCLLGLAPLLFLHQTQGKGTATATTVIAVAGKDVGGISSQPQEAVVLCSKPADGGSGRETAFATISTVAVPCKIQGPGMTQNLSGSVFIVTVTVAMAVKRVQKFIRSRKKSEQ